MKLAEMKELSPDEMVTELKKAQVDLANLRMKFVSRQLQDPSLIKKKRKAIARLFTLQTLKLKEESVKLPEKSKKTVNNNK